MTAPALITLAHGSRDPRSAATIKALVAETRADAPRPAHRAGLPRARPSPTSPRVVDRLVKAGFDEIVVVPLLLSDAYHAKVDVPDAVAEATERHPGLQIRVTNILGLEPTFLEVLDRRLREALRQARVRELDALVLAAAGSSDPLANQAIARLARVWGARHKLPVTAAFASAAPPATGEAVRAFRARGSPPRGRRLDVPGAGLPARPGRGARPGGRRRRGLRAARLPTRSWPARSWPATPWAPWSSSRSEPIGRAPQPRRSALQQPLSSAAGSSVRPPCTGPGWTTVLRGARRKPNRLLGSSAAGARRRTPSPASRRRSRRAPRRGTPAPRRPARGGPRRCRRPGSSARSRSSSTSEAEPRKSSAWQ